MNYVKMYYLCSSYLSRIKVIAIRVDNFYLLHIISVIYEFYYNSVE